MDEHWFDIGGERFFAISKGDPAKPLLLFLHGFPEFSGAWEEVFDHISDDWFCVAPDQRGYGLSWRPEGVEHYQTRLLVADALSMIEYFGQGRAAAVVGHDWGASIAYATAIRQPDIMDRLVILNGVHPVPFQNALAAGGAQSKSSAYISWMRQPGAAKVLARDDFAKMFSLFSINMDMDWMDEDKLAAYRAAWTDEAGLRAMINWYRASPMVVADAGQPLPTDQMPQWDLERMRIRMPHLLIWGQKDTALLPESRAGLSGLCDDLTVVEHPDADHWIAHQHPRFVADQIQAFLAQ